MSLKNEIELLKYPLMKIEVLALSVNSNFERKLDDIDH